MDSEFAVMLIMFRLVSSPHGPFNLATTAAGSNVIGQYHADYKQPTTGNQGSSALLLEARSPGFAYRLCIH